MYKKKTPANAGAENITITQFHGSWPFPRLRAGHPPAACYESN